MVNVIRLGLFGASNILEKAMCDAFINHPNIVVVGLASKSLIRLESLSNKLKCQKYNSYDSLINSNKIDAAYISLPNSMHYEISKKLKSLVILHESCHFINVKWHFNATFLQSQMQHRHPQIQRY